MYIESAKGIENASDERMRDRWRVRVVARGKKLGKKIGEEYIQYIQENRDETAWLSDYTINRSMN